MSIRLQVLLIAALLPMFGQSFAQDVSTEPMRQAAADFLGVLSELQRSATQFPVDSPEWQHWSNISNSGFARTGTSLKTMSADQRYAANGLLSETLSARGYELARNIMKTDHTLSEINPDAEGLDENLYFYTVMGEPSSDEPWGWQLDGHHLVINTFVLGDQVVMTPMFLGGEPVVTMSGKYAGNVILQQEQNQGLDLLQSLSEEQRAQAIIDPDKTGSNMVAGAGQDDLVVEPVGIPAPELDEQQRMQLLDLIELYVGNMRDGHAQVRMAEVAEHLDETRFAWIGATSDDAVFYYRIHSPVILIEFDHQRPIGMRRLLTGGEPTRQHIHTIIRTPNGNDYGRDLLREHLEAHPH